MGRADLLVVVPAYNEEGSIADVVRMIHESAPPCDVVVIDDGSTDRTAQRAREAGALIASVPFNVGIGGAVQTGFKFARDKRYEFVAQVDGDGQHDPEALEILLSKLRSDGTLDVVCGSRFLDGMRCYRVPLARRLGIRLFAAVLTLMLRHRVTDPTSGFRLYNQRAIEFFASNYPHDYPEVEALLMLRASGFRFSEVGVPMYSRARGRSSITRMGSGYYMIKVSLALLAGLLRGPLDISAGALGPEA